MAAHLHALTQIVSGLTSYYSFLTLKMADCLYVHQLKSQFMKKGYFFPVIVTLIVAGLVACNSDNKTASKVDTGGLSPETLALDINAIPTSLANTYTSKLKFNRYTKVVAPNGKAIHIIAQDQLSDNQIVRARSILTHYLTPYPDSEYGADKSSVANKLADNHANLLLLNGSDDGSNPAGELEGQPLYQNEIQVEGHSWYINQNYDHRDAAFEEILHLVHDYGIGVDQNEDFIGALPDFQAEIRAAQITAVNDKIWAWSADNADWLAELTEENSLSQEYLASVIDSYYGLWGASDGQYGMWGLYKAKKRSDIAVQDPEGAVLMNNKFFHPYLTYDARIDASFDGTFSLRFDPAKSYTHHAQYLKDVTLTGDKASNVVVNQMNNHITGNSGANKVYFKGNSSQYSIEKQDDGSTVITDRVDDRDGKNTLVDIEAAKFSDTSIIL